MWTIISGLTVGVLLGFVMQRTRFCLTGGFRDMYVQKNNKMFYALLVAISIQAVGLFVLTSIGVLTIHHGTYPIIGTIIGSFIFGVGIGLFAAISKFGILLPLKNVINSPTVVNADISTSTGIPSWVWITALVSITLFLVIKTLRKPKPKVMIPKLKSRYTGVRYFLFEKRFHPFVAAIAVGLIALIAWPMSYSTGREGGLGITTPSAHIIQFLTTGDLSLIDWGVFLVLGIFLGSYVAARGAKEFKWRLPDIKAIRNSAIGGAFMGFGAAVAGGCSIGNGLVATAALSWQGWLGLASMILGTWFMSYFLFVKPLNAARRQTQIASTSASASH